MIDVHTRGFCPRCLLKDSPSGAELAALIAQWIEALPEDRRADEEITQARLEICERCGHLSDGVCALCGCYVEFRAAQKIQRCPENPDRWQKA